MLDHWFAMWVLGLGCRRPGQRFFILFYFFWCIFFWKLKTLDYKSHNTSKTWFKVHDEGQTDAKGHGANAGRAAPRWKRGCSALVRTASWWEFYLQPRELGLAAQLVSLGFHDWNLVRPSCQAPVFSVSHRPLHWLNSQCSFSSMSCGKKKRSCCLLKNTKDDKENTGSDFEPCYC